MERRPTGVAPVDAIFGGGVVQGHAILLYGSPGAGKTTLCLHVLEKAKTPIFLSAEEPENQIASRAAELGIDAPRIQFAAETEIGAIERMAMKHRPSDLVIDSLSCLYDKRTGRPAGSSWTLKEAMSRLFVLAHSLSMTTWIICHINKKGQATGPSSVAHWSDAIVALTKEKQEVRRLSFATGKNRGGATNLSARMTMSRDLGLELIEVVDANAEFDLAPIAAGQGEYTAR